MRLLQKVKRGIGGRALDTAKRLGFDLQRDQGLDLQISKLRSIKNPASRLHAAEELVRKYPRHPKPHFELAVCLHHFSDMRQFEQLDRYGEIRRQWMVKTGLAEIDMEFIWSGMVIGSLGNHYAIEGLLKANQGGLRHPKNLFLLLPEKAMFRNPALYEYFAPHINIIHDPEVIQSMKRLESLLTLPLGMALPINDACPFLDIAANLTKIEMKKKGVDGPIFQVSDHHRDMGLKALQRLGLPKDAWYVTLHVREPGYRGETAKNTTENWRNANPLDYLKACEVITKAGGWVFRMGDPSMTPLPPTPQVIDYAHHEIRCDWLDVFLAATCRFCIGTASGYFRIPRYFGVPVIFTNCTNTAPYFSLMEYDLFLPRLLKRQSTRKYLSFYEIMSPPVSMYWSMRNFAEDGINWDENTPEELEAATNEMIERTDGKFSSRTSESLQLRFKVLAENCGLQYGGRPVKAFASISQDFLERHVDLLEGID